MSKRYYDPYPLDKEQKVSNDVEEKMENEMPEPVSHPAEQESMEPETKEGIVVGADLVRLRAEPSLDAKVLTTVRSKEKVEVSSEPSDNQTDFYGVKYGGFNGFIQQRFLVIK